MTRIKLLLAVAATVGLTSGVALAQTGGAEIFPLPGDEVYPEGVAHNPATGDFFVGSTTDGAVFRGDAGEPGKEARTFLEPGADGRSTAIGMKVDEGGSSLSLAARRAGCSSTTRAPAGSSTASTTAPTRPLSTT